MTPYRHKTGAKQVVKHEIYTIFQAVVVLFAAVAYASAGGYGIVGDKGALEGALGGQWINDVGHEGIAGAGIVGAGVSAKGALEGALGGQWIPDVPVAHGAAIAAPGLGLGIGLGGVGLGGHGLGVLGLGGLGLGGVGLGGVGLGGIGLGHGVSRGAVEGALGGQWIPDTHGK